MVATRVETPAHQPALHFSIMPINRKKKMCPELKVHRVDGVPQIEAGEKQHIAGMYYAVRVRLGEQTQQTRTHGKGHESHIEQDMVFHAERVDGRESVIAEILDDQNQVLSRGNIGMLGDFIEGRKGARFELDSGAAVVISSTWTQEPKQP
ncbi:hypothetical protein P43SY_008725 [Pythium insidiosum]|uniref:Uncharacterized protein n=1 Tax=Pythium insidiosum TaxID=114742 RepID=A0AAD5LBL4_PYTIN|nr:hypothetical protein P43SY_008725 [Pythium insidiosum]